MATYIHSLVQSAVAWAAALGTLGMTAAASLLLVAGVPVLVLLTGLTVAAGFRGLVAVVIAVFVAAYVLHMIARLVRPGRSHGAGSPWIFLGAAVVPYWPFVVVASVRGTPFRRIAAALAIVSGPTYLLFAISMAIGRKFDIPAIFISISAAVCAIALRSLLLRPWRRRHEDLPALAGLERRPGTSRTAAESSRAAVE